jgi:phosphoserine phosphatase
MRMDRAQLEEFWTGMRRVLRTVSEEVRKAAKLNTDELRRNVRRVIRSELYSDRFAEFLRRVIATPPTPPSALAELARTYQAQGRPVVVTTISGSVEGLVTEVGENYAVIREPSGTLVIVNLENTIAIRPQGLE